MCGDDAEAKKVVAQLVKDLGLEPFDTGPLYHARYLEALAMLYIDMVYVQAHDPHFTFTVATRTVKEKPKKKEMAGAMK